MFQFWTPENVWKLYDFLKFSGGKKWNIVVKSVKNLSDVAKPL